MAYRTNGAPEEIAEVHDQVGRYTVACFVNFLRLKDSGTNMRTVVVDQGFEFSFQFVAQRLNLEGLNDSLWLTALDIEKDTSIVAAVPPDFGPAP